MGTLNRIILRSLGVGLVIVGLSADNAKAQYGRRANPITGLRTGMRYQPALASPFATARVGGLGTSVGLSRYGGFYGSNFGPRLGVNRYASRSFRSGWGLGRFGIGGLGVRRVGYNSVGFGLPVATSFSLNIGGVGYPGYGYGAWGLGYPTYGVGYGSPWVYGGYPYGTVGVRQITYGTSYPYGWIGYSGFPYSYGYGYGGGYFGY